MISQSKYQINPDIIWVNESKGRVAVINPHTKENIHLKGFECGDQFGRAFLL